MSTEMTQAEQPRAVGLPRPSFQVGIDEALARPQQEPIRRTMKDFMPLRDQVLVRRVVQDEMSESGIIFLPANGKEKPWEAEVLAVGPGKFDLLGRFWPTQIEVGDRIVFGKYDGREMKLRGEDVLLLSEDQVLGVIR